MFTRYANNDFLCKFAIIANLKFVIILANIKHFLTIMVSTPIFSRAMNISIPFCESSHVSKQTCRALSLAENTMSLVEKTMRLVRRDQRLAKRALKLGAVVLI